MQPQQIPQPAPPPMIPSQNSSNPYNFILNPQQPPKKRLLLSSSSPKARIITVLAGLLALIVLGSIMSSVISSSAGAGTKSLIDIAGQQQELVRISKIGTTSAKSKTTLNLAITTQLVVSSDQASLLSLLKRSNIKLNLAQLNSHKNLQTDALLTQASQTNQFDDVYAQIQQRELNNYQLAIKTAYTKNKGLAARKLLNREFDNSKTLVIPSVN
ncbi:MAG: hypothetical protein NVS1B7_2170 [Candidatus Saccharimonadales bacterium]